MSYTPVVNGRLGKYVILTIPFNVTKGEVFQQNFNYRYNTPTVKRREYIRTIQCILAQIRVDYCTARGTVMQITYSQ